MKLNEVYLALGTNVGDKTKNLSDAIDLIGERIKVLKTSRIYPSKPMGFKNQDTFLNMVIFGKTHMDLMTLFEFVKDVERRVGRVERFRWGPREIDVDILFYNDEIYNSEILTVPHLRLHERDFVLIPLMDINPDLIHPVFKVKVKDLLRFVKEETIIV